MFITPKALYWVSRSALVTSRRRLHSLRARSARYEIDSRVIGAFPETSANYSRAPDSRLFGAARDGDAAPNAAAPCGVSCFGAATRCTRNRGTPGNAYLRSSLTHTMRSGGASPQRRRATSTRHPSSRSRASAWLAGSYVRMYRIQAPFRCIITIIHQLIIFHGSFAAHRASRGVAYFLNYLPQRRWREHSVRRRGSMHRYAHHATSCVTCIVIR